MGNLETIISQIIAEAEANAEAILADGKAQSEALLRQAHEVAEQRISIAEEEGTVSAKVLSGHIASGCAMEKRRRLLKKKQDLVSEAVNDALSELCALPDEQYFDTLIDIVSKHALCEKGSLLLNEADRKRMPADFMSRLAPRLPLGAELSLSEKSCVGGGGCVLVYGDIEVNCQFSAMFSSMLDELQDIAHDTMFS